MQRKTQSDYARSEPSRRERNFWMQRQGAKNSRQNTRTPAESRLRKSEQGDKWNFCLTAGKIGPRIRRDDEQTSTPEPHPGFQGEGGACRRQGRPNTGSTGGAVRRPPQSDHIVEGAA